MFQQLQQEQREFSKPSFQENTAKDKEATAKASADPLPVMQQSSVAGKETSLPAAPAPKESEGGSAKTEELENELAADPAVTISEVNSPTTPDGMNAKRIPPRVTTTVYVSVSGIKNKKRPVVLRIKNQNASNGKASFNGANEYTINADGTIPVPIKGDEQTSEGSAGQLMLAASHTKKGIETPLQTSNGFSVSAIPQNWSFIKKEVFTELYQAGMTVNSDWQSDSGIKDDLDGVEQKELVELKKKGGDYENVDIEMEVGGWIKGNAKTENVTDTHTMGSRTFKNGASKEVDQVHIFKDKRTNAAQEIAGRNSGYLITGKTTPIEASDENSRFYKFYVDVTKTGNDATALGFSSEAGTGSDSVHIPRSR